MLGVGIDWVHKNAAGAASLDASKLAAGQVVGGYGIVYRPALESRHTEGKAIDMNVSWTGAELTVRDGGGKDVIIKTGAKNGGNPELHKVGKSYNVIKLVSDAPHWSSGGR